MKLGIDIGGTNITLGLVENGIISESKQIEPFVSDVVRGIGVPSVVDVEKGIVFDTVNIPSWKEVRSKGPRPWSL